jgi:hypothetical protein
MDTGYYYDQSMEFKRYRLQYCTAEWATINFTSFTLVFQKKARIFKQVEINFNLYLQYLLGQSQWEFREC